MCFNLISVVNSTDITQFYYVVISAQQILLPCYANYRWSNQIEKSLEPKVRLLKVLLQKIADCMYVGS